METTQELYRVSDLSSSVKTMLIDAYDEYIQYANDEDLYSSGWRPVCIEEFLNNEFLFILKDKGYQIVKKESR